MTNILAREDLGHMKAKAVWRVVHDGDSLGMLASPDGRIFSVQELGAGHHRGPWGNANDNDELCEMMVRALNDVEASAAQLRAVDAYGPKLDCGVTVTSLGDTTEPVEVSYRFADGSGGCHWDTRSRATAFANSVLADYPDAIVVVDGHPLSQSDNRG